MQPPLVHHVHWPEHTGERFSTFINRAVYVAGFAGPLTAVPQIIQIFSTRSAEDISLLTYIGYVAMAILWLCYGIVHRATPLIISNALWIVFELVIIAGILLYPGNAPGG